MRWLEGRRPPDVTGPIYAWYPLLKELRKKGLGTRGLIALGFLASMAAGVATGVGAISVLFTKRVQEWLMDALLGFAAEVVLAAAAFSFLMPAMEIGGISATMHIKDWLAVDC